MSNVRVRRSGSRARCASSRSMRPRWSAITGVSGGSKPCSTYISRMRCLAGGFRLSVPRRCSMVLWSTPLGPTTRAPSASSDGGSFDTQRVRGTGERPLVERRSTPPVVDHAHGVGMPWSAARPAADSRSLAPWLVKETDDAVAAKVRRVRHRRAPVAVGANQDMLMDQRRIARDERADRVEVIAPDRVGESHARGRASSSSTRW